MLYIQRPHPEPVSVGDFFALVLCVDAWQLQILGLRIVCTIVENGLEHKSPNRKKRGIRRAKSFSGYFLPLAIASATQQRKKVVLLINQPPEYLHSRYVHIHGKPNARDDVIFSFSLVHVIHKYSFSGGHFNGIGVLRARRALSLYNTFECQVISIRP